MKPNRERGFALLIVLWSMALLALMITTVLANGRTAITLAGNVRDAAAADARADGAINEALFHALANGAEHWAPDGSWHDLPEGVRVRVTTLGGLINPNLAPTNLLAGLLQACGADEAQAKRAAGRSSIGAAHRSPQPRRRRACRAIAAPGCSLRHLGRHFPISPSWVTCWA